MKFSRDMGIIVLVLLAGTSTFSAKAQDKALHVMDFVDMPRDLMPGILQQDQQQVWFIEFEESWHISPEGPGISKSVISYAPKIRDVHSFTPDSLRQRFAILVQQLPQLKGMIRLDPVSYEFMLLDPHVVSSGNIAFPEPDSMDRGTIDLQGRLIDLVKSRSYPARRYDLQKQLLSVHFHEQWTIDPLSLQISKKVVGITPVIWQRRQTTSGEPVNDAETGLPVYYKNQLPRFNLHHPHKQPLHH